MNFLNFKRIYISALNIDEFRIKAQEILDEKLLFGLLRNKGEVTNSSFEFNRIVTTNLSGLPPKVSGNYKDSDKGPVVELLFKPHTMAYVMEGFALIMTVFSVFNPNTTINGELSDFYGRLSFGLFFIIFWTITLVFLSYVPFVSIRNKIEKEFQLTRIDDVSNW